MVGKLLATAASGKCFRRFHVGHEVALAGKSK